MSLTTACLIWKTLHEGAIFRGVGYTRAVFCMRLCHMDRNQIWGSTVRACWVDNIELPSSCVYDTDEAYNCLHAGLGVLKFNCQYWDESRTIKLCEDLLSSR
jgi:hypothetical protein